MSRLAELLKTLTVTIVVGNPRLGEVAHVRHGHGPDETEESSKTLTYGKVCADGRVDLTDRTGKLVFVPELVGVVARVYPATGPIDDLPTSETNPFFLQPIYPGNTWRYVRERTGADNELPQARFGGSDQMPPPVNNRFVIWAKFQDGQEVQYLAQAKVPFKGVRAATTDCVIP